MTISLMMQDSVVSKRGLCPSVVAMTQTEEYNDIKVSCHGDKSVILTF